MTYLAKDVGCNHIDEVTYIKEASIGGKNHSDVNQEGVKIYLEHLDERHGQVEVHNIAKVQCQRHEQPNRQDLRDPESPGQLSLDNHPLQHLQPTHTSHQFIPSPADVNLCRLSSALGGKAISTGPLPGPLLRSEAPLLPSRLSAACRNSVRNLETSAWIFLSRRQGCAPDTPSRTRQMRTPCLGPTVPLGSGSRPWTSGTC